MTALPELGCRTGVQSRGFQAAAPSTDSFRGSQDVSLRWRPLCSALGLFFFTCVAFSVFCFVLFSSGKIELCVAYGFVLFLPQIHVLMLDKSKSLKS